MAKTLAQFKPLVSADLTDAAKKTWSDGELERAIRRALWRYSQVRPQDLVTTIAAKDGREYSHGIPGLLDVRRVWWPYDALDVEASPKWVDFELWHNKTILVLRTGECPTVGDLPLRVYYTAFHTISGLDSAAASTYYDEDEETLVLGAVAYAALQRSRYVIDAVNPSADVPADFRSWAQAREREFEDELKRIGRRVGRHWDSRVAVVVDV